MLHPPSLAGQGRSGGDPAPELRQAGAAVGAALQAGLQLRDGFRGCQEGVDLAFGDVEAVAEDAPPRHRQPGRIDRKSTRLNSSHGYISYAVFCLKKKKKNK